MSIDCHIKFKGVDGESGHKDHKGEIEVISWGWGVSNGSSSAAGGGSGKGKGTPGDFQFVHGYDKSSPVLAKSCASGKHFDEVVMTGRKSGEGQLDFFKVTMKEVLVTSVRPSGSSGGDIAETITCSYKDIEFSYKPQDDKGALGGEVKFGWNVASTETR